MEKRIERLPIILATLAQEKMIRDYLHAKRVSFSTFALEAVLEKIAREEEPKPLAPARAPRAEVVPARTGVTVEDRVRRINRDRA